ncbi:tail fiber assembly protein [Providencia rettgeri]
MIYFKNDDGVVFAYPKEDIAQTERLTELETLIEEKEPIFTRAKMQLQQKQDVLDELVVQFNNLMSSDEVSDDELQQLHQRVITATEERDLSLVEFNEINSVYSPLKEEFDAVPPAFFDIRENLKVIKKMSSKEIDAHLNPPVSKEQLIAEAEQRKQILLSEATEAIAPLQDAVELDIATDKEIALLKEWKKYRVLLNRVDTSLAPNIEWPQKPL